MTTLYNLHTDGDQYRITKFVDGNPEASYLLSHSECQCPAGHRATCRHRQMLPQMLAHDLLNSFWFWHFDLNCPVDMGGFPRPHSPTATTTEFDSVDVGSTPAVAATSMKSWRRI